MPRPKSVHLDMRITLEQKLAWAATARGSGLTLSSWICSLADAVAPKAPPLCDGCRAKGEPSCYLCCVNVQEYLASLNAMR
jgi:hypothetical protein